ncbi:NhaP NhaP-type Na+ H+ and K+ H+ antiporter [Pyrenophora tritici-repentis]|uniref:Na antiporter n=1 Tax=Pyrenophora tritici-repentis TaxID=45151 RepID=A0A2W1G7G0_9PLEO|nr:Na(+)/H(+) antiporter 2 [Pyrenophora tritici-repentis]KAF7448475.1 Na antiporter 2 [Pyrenophora tritici-repentis]KAF7572197.1 NhaP, NhaP-type Na+-H+ and K+-H+ antiporter [Pyrenophora tritici-repentis]KAG9384621.1 Na antiporter 2 [Pyrenophora tritici-repentis]KAI0588249.1 Na(+)/H(+) antiporter 2 [Pyrenophora tritici-repentis]
MPTLALNNFNIVCATLGGFITAFGLVSYLMKEKFYLSEALISLVAGLIFSPHATNWIRPEEYALNNEVVLDTITLYFTRLVLGVQLVLAGVQLPSKYLKTEWKSLALLLGPVMTVMWLVTSLLVYALVPHISFLHALAVGACVTPTDPVLSNSIVKGKFADKNIPKELQKIIVAESGANDGLGYPFLFLPLYLIQHIGHGGQGSDNSTQIAVGLWFGETWAYTILLSVVYGAVVGWVAKELLHWAEEKKYVDRESFLVFAITLALFIVGTVGMIGSDDVLACFIAGNTFTWDDWFRLETMDDSFQPTIDMLLNVSIFIWFGAVAPWRLFATSPVIPIYRLIPLGILVLMFRRPPIIFAMHKQIHQIEQRRQALFVGFFGPIGVSAIFYLYISLEFLSGIRVNGEIREDCAYLMEVMKVVIWFLVICSVIIHGLSIPMGKLGFHIPRTLSSALSFGRSNSGFPDEPEAPFHVRDENITDAESRVRRRPGWSRNGGDSLPNRVVRIGRSLISSGTSSASTSRANSTARVAMPIPPLSDAGSEGRPDGGVTTPAATAALGEGVVPGRTIRFRDEQAEMGTSKADRKD